MSSKEIFSKEYVENISTSTIKKESQTKKFLKSPLQESDIKKYGTSMPRRIVIRAKIHAS